MLPGQAAWPSEAALVAAWQSQAEGRGNRRGEPTEDPDAWAG